MVNPLKPAGDKIVVLEKDSAGSFSGGHRGRPFWEYVVFIAIMAFALYFVVKISVKEVDHFKKMMLHQQLWQIRNAVLVYYVTHGDWPANLEILASTEVTAATGAPPFRLVENVSFDQEGKLVDPLGYPFSYDREHGIVKSLAPCCQYW